MAIKIGDKVTLHFDEPSLIGHNGILCKVKMTKEKNGETFYFCESIYGTATCWAKEKELSLQNKPQL